MILSIFIIAALTLLFSYLSSSILHKKFNKLSVVRMDLLDIEKINKEMALLACTINGSIYNHRFDESIVAI